MSLLIACARAVTSWWWWPPGTVICCSFRKTLRPPSKWKPHAGLKVPEFSKYSNILKKFRKERVMRNTSRGWVPGKSRRPKKGPAGGERETWRGDAQTTIGSAWTGMADTFSCVQATDVNKKGAEGAQAHIGNAGRSTELRRKINIKLGNETGIEIQKKT